MLSEKFREEAKRQREAAGVLLKAEGFDRDVTKQVAAIVGLCEANMLSALADVVEFLRETVPMDSQMAKRRAIIDRNDIVRKAAARASQNGDWSEFDRIVAGEGGVGGPGGNPA